MMYVLHVLGECLYLTDVCCKLGVFSEGRLQ